MLGIIFGAAGMLLVYYTVQVVFGPVDKDFLSWILYWHWSYTSLRTGKRNSITN